MKKSIRRAKIRLASIAAVLTAIIAAGPAALGTKTGFAFGSSLVASETAVQRDADRPRIDWPSSKFRTLQEAIDAAPNDAIVRIKPGTYQIQEPIFVRNKRLILTGAGSGRRSDGNTSAPITHLVGPRPSRVLDERGNLILRGDAVVGLLNFIASDVVVRHLRFSGFDAAIVSRNDDRGNAAPIHVRDCVVANTGRGILSLSAGKVTVDNCTIQHTLWNAVSIAPHVVNSLHLVVTLAHMVLLDAQGAGIYLSNTAVNISNATVTGAIGGGIVATNTNGVIDSCLILANWKAGVLWHGPGSVAIQNTVISHTFSLAGLLGDGVTVWNQADAFLVHDYISNSQRAGVSNYGATAHLYDCDITCSAFDIASEPWQGIDAAFEDLGSNVCGCQGIFDECNALSYELAPPPPVGGLE